MKKRIAAVIVAVLVCTLIFTSCSSKSENESKYTEQASAMDIFDNTLDEQMPQTIVHKLVTDHFNSPLPAGKKVKKAIFIGYDGFRVDGLNNIKDLDNSAIMYVKSLGGLYHTFSGGVAGKNEQATSTAPSWMAMLTGGWGDYNGITDNSQMKNPNAKTFLTEQAENGRCASFTTSWREHTELSYRPDIANSIKNNISVEYTHQIDDTATYYQILKYVSKPAGEEKIPEQDPDCIFFTLEYTDHAGHSTGYKSNDEYIQACKDDENYGYDIIKTIEARSTYDEEDWLIVISTDHGGKGTGHGGQTSMEKLTWLACNKAIDVNDDYLNYEVK